MSSGEFAHTIENPKSIISTVDAVIASYNKITDIDENIYPNIFILKNYASELPKLSDLYYEQIVKKTDKSLFSSVLDKYGEITRLGDDVSNALKEVVIKDRQFFPNIFFAIKDEFVSSNDFSPELIEITEELNQEIKIITQKLDESKLPDTPDQRDAYYTVWTNMRHYYTEKNKPYLVNLINKKIFNK